MPVTKEAGSGMTAEAPPSGNRAAIAAAGTWKSMFPSMSGFMRER